MGWSLTLTWGLAEKGELSQSDRKNLELGLCNPTGRVNPAKGSCVTSGLIFVRGPNCLHPAHCPVSPPSPLPESSGCRVERGEKGGEPALCHPTSLSPELFSHLSHFRFPSRAMILKLQGQARTASFSLYAESSLP